MKRDVLCSTFALRARLRLQDGVLDSAWQRASFWSTGLPWGSRPWGSSQRGVDAGSSDSASSSSPGAIDHTPGCAHATHTVDAKASTPAGATSGSCGARDGADSGAGGESGTSHAASGRPKAPPRALLRSLGRRRDAAATAATAAAAAAAAAPPGPGLMAVLGAMAGVARGLGNTGLGQVTFGLQALARRHEEQGLQDHPAGRPLPPGPATEAEAERLLDALELAHGAYRKSAAALAATTCLRAQHIHVWRPQGGSLQPAYYVAVDHPGRRVVWGVRGTRVFADLLTDLSMAAHPLGAGAAHWGMTHAAHWLLQQEAKRVAALLRSLRPAGAYRLELVGHSMGGAVAALATVMLRERLVETARAAAIPPDRISCVAFAPPSVMSPELAALCRPYVTSVVLNNDIVPRFNASSMALLQEELQGVDWYAELQRTVLEHTIVKGVSSTLGALTTSSLSPTTVTATPAALPTSTALTAPRDAPSVPQASLSDAAQLPVAAAAAAVQQLSAAVLESAAFRSALHALDDWKAKAVAAAGEPAEAAIKRQADVIRAWLQDVATGKQQQDAAGPAAAQAGGNAADAPSPPADAIKLAAEAAAERLRSSLDAAMSSLTAAAAASRDRLSASLPAVPSLPSLPSLPELPSLPSLPRAHELPLIEPEAVAAAAAAAAASAQGAAAAAAAEPGSAGTAREAGGDALVALRTQDMPLLLPPGRILYIRPRPELDQVPASSAAAGTRDILGPQDVGRGRDGPEDTARPSYILTELPEGEGFRRLVLGRAALEEHQCRAYRRVLMQLALQS